MKYSQFLEFQKALEKNKISVDEWKKNPGIKLIKEADEESGDSEKKELDTKSGNILTKRGRQRMALNKHAKKLQEQINKDVADKFLKPIFDLKAQIYKKMAEMGKGKQPKEIVEALKSDLKNVQKIQSKQIAIIEKHAQTAIDTMTQKIDASVDKAKLKDTTKANLKTYWSLLTTQIMMNLLQKIAVKDDGLIGETIKDEEILKAARAINRALNKELSAKTEQKKKAAAERKKQIAAEDEKAAEEGGESEKSDKKEGEEETKKEE